jgi:hypothetical protein
VNDVVTGPCFIWCYRGLMAEPRWKDVDTSKLNHPPCQRNITINYHISLQTENYTELCSIAIDLSILPPLPREKLTGGTYYELAFDVVLLFGLTELKAQIAWEEGVGGISYIPRRYWEVLIQFQIH